MLFVLSCHYNFPKKIDLFLLIFDDKVSILPCPVSGVHYTLPNKHNFHFDLQIASSPFWTIFLDSGAQTYFYLNDNPSVKYKLIEKISLASLLLKNSQELEQLAFNKYEQVFIRSMQGYKGGQFVSTEFHFNGSFLHISNSRYIDILSCEIDPYFVFFNNILQKRPDKNNVCPASSVAILSRS